MEPMDKTFGIGRAVKDMHEGHAVRRASWAAGRCLRLVKDWNGSVGYMPPDYVLLPFIVDVTGNGEGVPWIPGHADILAIDWQYA